MFERGGERVRLPYLDRKASVSVDAGECGWEDEDMTPASRVRRGGNIGERRSACGWVWLR